MPDGEIESVRHRQRLQNRTEGEDVREGAKRLYQASRRKNAGSITREIAASVRAVERHGVDGREETARDDTESSNGKGAFYATSKLGAARTEGANELHFYPAYCHTTSPTYFKWVNLTAHEIVHVLKKKDGYMHSWQTADHKYGRDAPQLLFYLNHPIQFVQVVGVVVNLEEWFERFWLFTIDDSSGSTIDVVCKKPEKTATDGTGPSVADEEGAEEVREIERLSEQVVRDVHIGKVLQVKGTIALFQRNKTFDSVTTTVPIRRGLVGGPGNTAAGIRMMKQEHPVRQIALARLSVVHDTNQEISLIEARTKFHQNVLSSPWHVSQASQRSLHKKALGEVEHGKKKLRKLAEKQRAAAEMEREDAKTIMQAYEMEEIARAEEGERVRLAVEHLLPVRVEKDCTGGEAAFVAETQPSGETYHLSPEAKTTSPEKKRKKRKSLTVSRTAPSTVPALNETSLSFSADDGEKSALLRAAFG